MRRLQSGFRGWQRISMLAIVFLAAVALWLRELPWQADFSTWPPAGVYRMVLGELPPLGVTGIRAAGRHYATKRWVWMRLSATDAALRTLAAQGTPLTGPEAAQRLGQRWSASDRFDADDMRRVGWPDAAALSGLPAFEFPTGNASSLQWHGVIVEDRAAHTAYIVAMGD